MELGFSVDTVVIGVLNEDIVDDVDVESPVVVCADVVGVVAELVDNVVVTVGVEGVVSPVVVVDELVDDVVVDSDDVDEMVVG